MSGLRESRSRPKGPAVAGQAGGLWPDDRRVLGVRVHRPYCGSERNERVVGIVRQVLPAGAVRLDRQAGQGLLKLDLERALVERRSVVDGNPANSPPVYHFSGPWKRIKGPEAGLLFNRTVGLRLGRLFLAPFFLPTGLFGRSLFLSAGLAVRPVFSLKTLGPAREFFSAGHAAATGDHQAKTTEN